MRAGRDGLDTVLYSTVQYSAVLSLRKGALGPRPRVWMRPCGGRDGLRYSTIKYNTVQSSTILASSPAYRYMQYIQDISPYSTIRLSRSHSTSREAGEGLKFVKGIVKVRHQPNLKSKV